MVTPKSSMDRKSIHWTEKLVAEVLLEIGRRQRTDALDRYQLPHSVLSRRDVSLSR